MEKGLRYYDDLREIEVVPIMSMLPLLYFNIIAKNKGVKNSKYKAKHILERPKKTSAIPDEHFTNLRDLKSIK